MLDKHITPHVLRCRETEKAVRAAEQEVAAGVEGAQAHLELARDEHDLAVTLRKSVMKYYLGFDE